MLSISTSFSLMGLAGAGNRVVVSFNSRRTDVNRSRTALASFPSSLIIVVAISQPLNFLFIVLILLTSSIFPSLKSI